MIRRLTGILCIALITVSSIAQEKSQSGLELQAPRAMVDEPVRAPTR